MKKVKISRKQLLEAARVSSKIEGIIIKERSPRKQVSVSGKKKKSDQKATQH
jgi:hypothetical protein